MNKICPQCKNSKPLNSDYFYRSKQTKSGFRPWCKICVNKSNQKYNEQHRDAQVRRVLKSRNRCAESKQAHVDAQKIYRKRNPLKYRDTCVATKFNLPKGWYSAKLEECKGKCEICGTEQLSERHKKYLAVDHCHETNKIRGLLCSRCNCGLGQFVHKPELLTAAIAYLKK